MLAIDAFGAYGVSQMKTEYDITWYMRSESYNVRFISELRRQFPDNGERVQLYLLGEIEYWNEHEQLMRAYDILKANEYIAQETVQFWYPVFHRTQCVSGPLDCSTGKVLYDFSRLMRVHNDCCFRFRTRFQACSPRILGDVP